MHYPVDKKYKITQGFGETEFSNKRGEEIYYFFDGLHSGIDFALPVGSNVYASLEGYVTSVEYHRGMGKTIRILHRNIQHIYGHLDSFCVEVGDYVKEGQLIAKSGETVAWSGPHLHFELRDLTVYEIKDRPFEPDFEKGIKDRYKEDFTYIANFSQALIDLSIKFFGSEKGVKILKDKNNEYSKLKPHDILPKGSKVLIG